MELTALAETAGADVVAVLMQALPAPNAATVIGPGKLAELKQTIDETDADLVIFDADLTPGQMKNLLQKTEKKIVDRSSLILDIFARHARTHEAQLQVELAQMEYYLPRLTRQWTHLSRQEGGIGTRGPTRGPGETQLEVDRRAVRKRIAYLRKKLDKIEQQRETRRKIRQHYQKVALVGYTNAGKSSLMNMLTDANTFVEDRLFATLDSTIRTLVLEDSREVLLIDTVGFIKKLPTHLVASFRSTLNETADADILMHVVDVSHPAFEEQIAVVLDILGDLGISGRPLLTVFNKIDRLKDRGLLTELAERYPQSVFTSATSGMGSTALRSELREILSKSEKSGTLTVPASASRLLAYMHEKAVVTEIRWEGNTARVTFRAAPDVYNKIMTMAKGVRE